MKEAKIAFCGAIVGALISTVGAMYANSAQQDNQALQHQLQQQTATIEKMSNILAYSGRIKGLVNGHLLQLVSAKQINELCISQAIQGKKSENCDMTQLNSEMNEFNKEIFDKTAKYRSFKMIARIYFCERTERLLSTTPFVGDWWNLTNEQSSHLIDTMYSEIGCKNL